VGCFAPGRPPARTALLPYNMQWLFCPWPTTSRTPVGELPHGMSSAHREVVASPPDSERARHDPDRHRASQEWGMHSSSAAGGSRDGSGCSAEAPDDGPRVRGHFAMAAATASASNNTKLCGGRTGTGSRPSLTMSRMVDRATLPRFLRSADHAHLVRQRRLRRVRCEPHLAARHELPTSARTGSSTSTTSATTGATRSRWSNRCLPCRASPTRC